MSNASVINQAVLIARFASVAANGRQWHAERQLEEDNPLPLGTRTRAPAVDRNFWLNVWNNPTGLPAGLPPIPSSRAGELRRPVDRVYERLGSNTNPRHFVLLQGDINGVKGRLEIFANPFSHPKFTKALNSAANGNETAVQEMLSGMRDVSCPEIIAPYVWRNTNHEAE